MGDIPYTAPHMIRRTIEESNQHSASCSQRYVFWENKAIRNDYEFVSCECTEACWCRKNKCNGHYKIREIDFDHFLDTYVHLWVPPKARESVRRAVLGGRTLGGRQQKAITQLQARFYLDAFFLRGVLVRCLEPYLQAHGLALRKYPAGKVFSIELWPGCFYRSLHHLRR